MQPLTFRETKAIHHLRSCDYHPISHKMMRYANDLTYEDITTAETLGIIRREHYPELYSHTDYFLTATGVEIVLQ